MVRSAFSKLTESTLRGSKSDATVVNTWEMGNQDSLSRPDSNQATQHPFPQYHGYQEEDSGPPSLPPAPLVPSTGFWHKVGKLESETWIVEILSLIASLVAAGVAIIYLRRYDGKPYPDLPKNITLNALLSVGMTIMVATIGIPLSSGLGQLNWIRSRKGPVTLSKMSLVDQGSRGAWGSFLVIFTWAGG